MYMHAYKKNNNDKSIMSYQPFYMLIVPSILYMSEFLWPYNQGYDFHTPCYSRFQPCACVQTQVHVIYSEAHKFDIFMSWLA